VGTGVGAAISRTTLVTIGIGTDPNTDGHNKESGHPSLLVQRLSVFAPLLHALTALWTWRLKPGDLGRWNFKLTAFICTKI
jgi:hypothetical protein